MISMRCDTWLNAEKLSKMIEETAMAGLINCAIAVEREAKKSMKQGGRMKGLDRTQAHVYYNSALGRYVRASKPEDPPNAQTRTLRNSIRHKRMSRHLIVVGPTRIARYGEWLEFGGKYMAARPFMRPALDRAKSSFPMLFRSVRAGSHRSR